MKKTITIIFILASYMTIAQQNTASISQELYTGPQLAKIQGQEKITINASKKIVWEAIHNSKNLKIWGPPVDSVEIKFKKGEMQEQLGTVRKVYATFGKKSGAFIEHRTEHLIEKKIGYMIDKDENFGITKMLKYPGFTLEIFEINEKQVEVEFIFYHKPQKIGILLNWMIKIQQKKNRHEALVSLKKYCESKM